MDEALGQIMGGFDKLEAVEGPTPEEKFEVVMQSLPRWFTSLLAKKIDAEFASRNQ